MPANDNGYWPMAAVTRLLRMAASWRRRRVARRRARLHGLMHMSDRMLADIGVRRADVHAALAGMVPVGQIGRTHGGGSWTAPVQTLRPQARPRSETLSTGDLGAAA